MIASLTAGVSCCRLVLSPAPDFNRCLEFFRQFTSVRFGHKSVKCYLGLEKQHDVKSYFSGEAGKGVGMNFRKNFLNVQWLLLKNT